MRTIQTRTRPNLLAVFTLAGLMLLLMLAGNSTPTQAHGFRTHMPYDLPACTARVLVCEAPSASFSVIDDGKVAASESDSLPTRLSDTRTSNARAAITGSSGRSCINGSGLPRSCELPGLFQYMPRFNGIGKGIGKRDLVAAQKLDPMSATDCVDGSAGPYPCSNVDLLSFIPMDDIGGGQGTDIWGWTDPDTGKEYALMGRSTGTSFVDISDPENPIHIGNLPIEDGVASGWTDIKVYQNHAYIVADDWPSSQRSHGVQIFDLTQLHTRATGTATLPLTLTSTAAYTGTITAHNIAINEESGFAYVVGSRHQANLTSPDDPDGGCNAGLYMLDLSTPASPTFGGCFASDGYVHDTQCVIYTGPDEAYQGREICFNSSEDTLTIVDVTDKSNPVQIARAWYASTCTTADETDLGVDCNLEESNQYTFYTHQGWLTENHAFFLQNDELDELGLDHKTRTYIWDVQDLDNPILKPSYNTDIVSLDHNLYIRDSYVYQANYTSGLRILDAATITTTNLHEVAYFDIHPGGYGAEGPTSPNGSMPFAGAWSNYPYFESGVVIVSGIDEGLFILRPNLSQATINNNYLPFIGKQ